MCVCVCMQMTKKYVLSAKMQQVNAGQGRLVQENIFKTPKKEGMRRKKKMNKTNGSKSGGRLRCRVHLIITTRKGRPFRTQLPLIKRKICIHWTVVYVVFSNDN